MTHGLKWTFGVQRGGEGREVVGLRGNRRDGRVVDRRRRGRGALSVVYAQNVMARKQPNIWDQEMKDVVNYYIILLLRISSLCMANMCGILFSKFISH